MVSKRRISDQAAQAGPGNSEPCVGDNAGGLNAIPGDVGVLAEFFEPQEVYSLSMILAIVEVDRGMLNTNFPQGKAVGEDLLDFFAAIPADRWRLKTETAERILRMRAKVGHSAAVSRAKADSPTVRSAMPFSVIATAPAAGNDQEVDPVTMKDAIDPGK